MSLFVWKYAACYRINIDYICEMNQVQSFPVVRVGQGITKHQCKTSDTSAQLSENKILQCKLNTF
jgi:hypothetical protein